MAEPGVVVLFVAALLSLVAFVVKAEYRYWGDITAKLLIELGTYFLSKSARQRRREEWLGELDSIQGSQDHAGLLFGAQMFLAGLRLTSREAMEALAGLLAGLLRDEPPEVPAKVMVGILAFTWMLMGSIGFGFSKTWDEMQALVGMAMGSTIGGITHIAMGVSRRRRRARTDTIRP